MNSDLPESATVPATAPEVPSAPVAPELPEAASAPEPHDAVAASEAVALTQAHTTSAAVPSAPASDAAAELKALFPALFTGRAKPVKLRVQADIQERAPGKFSKAQLSAFLRRHTGSTGYLIALTQAKTRFDLDGNPAGEISEEHLNAAKEELARRKGLQQERQQQDQQRQQLEIQQRRNRGQLLWDFERTTLTEANFCVLKGVVPEELAGLLEIARKERAEAPPPRQDRDVGRRDDRRPGGGGARPEGRGPRRPEQRVEGRRDQQRAERSPRGDRPPRGEGNSRPQQQGRKPAPQQAEQAAPSQMAQALQAATRAARVEPVGDVQPAKDQPAD